jgi:hypothetical protein
VVTERPVTRLIEDAVQARAWAMLFAARGHRPEWAAAFSPLDLDAEEHAHAAYLCRSGVTGAAGGSATARIVSNVAQKFDRAPRTDPVRVAASEVEAKAGAGELDEARDALSAWAELARARTRPDIPGLAGCRQVAPLLVAGADPLGLGGEWARRCAGDLIAALHMRYPGSARTWNWPELVAAVMRLRPGGAPPPGPAAPETLAKAEHRLNTRLPNDYRVFLLTCDGLPPDAVFPRLLSAAELVPAESGIVVISEPSEHGVVMLTPVGDGWLTVEWSPVLGTTTHRTFRRLMEYHLRLLQQAR